MLKKIRKIADGLSGQRTVCEFYSNELARRSDDDLQHSLTAVAPVSGRTILAPFKRKKRQEAEGAPYLAPPASAENEGLSTSFQEV